MGLVAIATASQGAYLHRIVRSAKDLVKSSVLTVMEVARLKRKRGTRPISPVPLKGEFTLNDVLPDSIDTAIKTLFHSVTTKHISQAIVNCLHS